MNESLPSAYCRNGCKPITSTNEFHCIICHKSFYGLAGYNDHRFDPDLPDEETMDYCFLPEDCDLVLEKGMWGFEQDHAERRKIEAKLEKARAAR